MIGPEDDDEFPEGLLEDDLSNQELEDQDSSDENDYNDESDSQESLEDSEEISSE